MLYCFFFKQKTAYEMRISDWSSDLCSSDLKLVALRVGVDGHARQRVFRCGIIDTLAPPSSTWVARVAVIQFHTAIFRRPGQPATPARLHCAITGTDDCRSEEHTSDLQSLMRSSYAVFCLKKKKHTLTITN